jgi:fructokinase
MVGIGEILWDFLPEGKKLGGAPANFAYHANGLGAEGVVVSCVGEDALGHEIVNSLARLGLTTEFIFIDSLHPTGTVQVELDENGVPTFTIHEDVAWDYLPATQELMELARRAEVVCFGSLAQRSEISQDTIRAFLEETRSGALRVFDINLRQSFYSPQVVEYSLSLANVFKLNEGELHAVSHLLELDGDVPVLLELLTEQYGLKLIALTRGDKGSLLFSEGQVSDHPGIPVHVVDTVGAGDAFTAALMLGMLRDFSLDKINDLSNRVASYVCTQAGATPEIPQELRNLFR